MGLVPPPFLTKINFIIRPNSMKKCWGEGRHVVIFGRSTQTPPVCDAPAVIVFLADQVKNRVYTLFIFLQYVVNWCNEKVLIYERDSQRIQSVSFFCTKSSDFLLGLVVAVTPTPHPLHIMFIIVNVKGRFALVLVWFNFPGRIIIFCLERKD